MSPGGNHNNRLQGLLPEKRRISRWAEFLDATGEAEYRVATLSRDRSLTLFAMILGALVAATFAIPDYQLYGDSPIFWQLFAIRGGLVAITLVALFGIRAGSTRRYDVWTTGWVVAALAIFVVIDQSRADYSLAHFAFDAVVLLAIYVVFVSRYRLQLLLGLSYTAALIILALAKNWSGVDQWALVSSVFAINLFGILLSWRFHTLARRQFATMLAERDLRVALEKLAFTDVLTEISNRRDYIARAEDEFERFRRHRSTFSLLVLDLDHFKQINDRFGHEVGDEVLKSFGGLLAEQARTNDLPARLGGEEFAVLLAETSIDQAEEVASRILKATREIKISASDKATVTVSIGITQVRLFDESIDDVMSRADRALYRAKDNGRDRAVSAAA